MNAKRFNTKRFNIKALAACVGIAVAGLGAVNNAQADAVAFAENLLTNFAITSTATLSVIGTPARTTFNSALFSGFPGSSAQDPVVLTAASNASQATSGPGPFPAENTYGFLAGTTGGMIGSRSDSNTSAGSPFGIGGVPNVNNVAEAHIASGSGSAGSSAGSNTAQATITIALGDSGTITFSFNDAYRYYANTTLLGETAQGTISNHFTIADSTGAIVYNDSPGAININCASNSGFPNPCDSGAITTSFADTSGLLTAGTYTISLASSSLANVGSVALLPEPGSILLFGLGLGALGFTMRRKQS